MTRSTILIVDDNPESLALTVRILQEAGHTIRAADGGIPALASAQASPPDLILLDVRM